MQHATSTDTDKGQLLPQPATCRRYGVSQMSLWRWQNNPNLGFPKSIKIAGRKYFYLHDLICWEKSLVRKCTGQAAAIDEEAMTG
jgi:predicted DNA-binding transcriptional regulator AlpA